MVKFEIWLCNIQRNWYQHWLSCLKLLPVKFCICMPNIGNEMRALKIGALVWLFIGRVRRVVHWSSQKNCLESLCSRYISILNWETMVEKKDREELGFDEDLNAGCTRNTSNFWWVSSRERGRGSEGKHLQLLLFAQQHKLLFDFLVGMPVYGQYRQYTVFNGALRFTQWAIVWCYCHLSICTTFSSLSKTCKSSFDRHSCAWGIAGTALLFLDDLTMVSGTHQVSVWEDAWSAVVSLVDPKCK